MRQIGTTGNLRMAHMRELPVGQVRARLQAATVTAGSARIDSKIGASLLHCQRPHIPGATNGGRFGSLDTRRGF